MRPGSDPQYKTGIALIYRELGVECMPMALNTGLCWPPKGIQRHPGQMVFEFLPAHRAGTHQQSLHERTQPAISKPPQQACLQKAWQRRSKSGQRQNEQTPGQKASFFTLPVNLVLITLFLFGGYSAYWVWMSGEIYKGAAELDSRPARTLAMRSPIQR